MLEGAFIKAIATYGVGAAFGIIVLAGAYFLLRQAVKELGKFGGRFIEAQNRSAEALGQQAAAMAGLTTAIQQAVVQDNSEHREMLTLLRFLAQRNPAYEEVLREHNERKEQAHSRCPVTAPKD